MTTDAANLLKVLADTEDRLKNWRPGLNRAAAYLELETKQNFAKQRDPQGNPWKPLAKSTLERKTKVSGGARRDSRGRFVGGGGGSTILRDTGALAAGIAARPASNTEASVETTAGKEYGIWHQLGTRRMPQRRYIGFSEQSIQRVAQILKDYLEEAYG